MKIAVLGIDGYIGWPLALSLLDKGYEVCGLDNYVRRGRVNNIRSDSLTPISSVSRRWNILTHYKNFHDQVANFNLTDNYKLIQFLYFHKPDVIVHLAEQPSAAWSMSGPKNAMETQHDNVLGTLSLLWAMKNVCPDAHLVKIGSMGEYGTPDCDIPEGEIPKKCISGWGVKGGPFIDGNTSYKCTMHDLPFPRSPNSFYHLSKVHDTHNIIFACKNWGLTSTDIMQGVVFGLINTEEELLTRLDYDEYFGTVINRFCVQAVLGHPLTIYGKGTQARGFLHLKDSIQCLTIAIENPPEKGEYRTFNQFESIYNIDTLAGAVARAAFKQGIETNIIHIKNPRKEEELHYYNPIHQKLFNLGYVPTTDIDREIENLINVVKKYRSNIIKDVIMPKTNW